MNGALCFLIGITLDTHVFAPLTLCSDLRRSIHQLSGIGGFRACDRKQVLYYLMPLVHLPLFS
jgi:hypothetical protein